MKSLHWLIAFVSMWGFATGAVVKTTIPQLFIAPSLVSAVFLFCLCVTNHMSGE